MFDIFFIKSLFFFFGNLKFEYSLICLIMDLIVVIVYEFLGICYIWYVCYMVGVYLVEKMVFNNYK